MKVLGVNLHFRPRKSINDKFGNDKFGNERIEKAMAQIDGVRRFAVGAARRFLPGGVFGSSAFQVRSTDDGWMIAERGSSLPLRVFSRKSDAVRVAKKMAQEHRVDVDIYTRRGELQNTVTPIH